MHNYDYEACMGSIMVDIVAIMIPCVVAFLIYYMLGGK